MKCLTCGSQRPDEDRYCGACGALLVAPGDDDPQPRGPLQFEFTSLEIPLNLVLWPATPERMDEIRGRYNEIVVDWLARAGREGWRSDEPTDFTFCDRTGRLRVSRRERRTLRASLFSGPLQTETTYESVTIRLKRPVS